MSSERQREGREEFGEGDEIGRRSILICCQKGGRERGEGCILTNVCLCELYLKVTAAPASQQRRADVTQIRGRANALAPQTLSHGAKRLPTVRTHF